MLSEATTRMQEQASSIRSEMKRTAPVLAGQIAEKLLGRKAA
jgi:hypothetical protein